MHFLSYELNGLKGLAVATESEFHGLLESHDKYPGTLSDILTKGQDLLTIGQTLLKAPLINLQDIKFLPPILRPGKILCIGLNYRAHATELGLDPPTFPSVFARFTSSLTGHESPLIRGKNVTQFDFEGELAVIIGRSGKNIPKEQALKHVAGYAIFNDGSVRDYSSLSTQWTLVKNFDCTGSFGPWLTTSDQLPSGATGLKVTTRLNGNVLQDGITSDMVFDPASLINLLSEVMTLEPGDVIITGTPPGVGVARNPQIFMKHGDICEVEIDRLGVLRNQVKDENSI